MSFAEMLPLKDAVSPLSEAMRAEPKVPEPAFSPEKLPELALIEEKLPGPAPTDEKTAGPAATDVRLVSPEPRSVPSRSVPKSPLLQRVPLSPTRQSAAPAEADASRGSRSS